jgi:hypothetical protein
MGFLAIRKMGDPVLSQKLSNFRSLNLFTIEYGFTPLKEALEIPGSWKLLSWRGFY